MSNDFIQWFRNSAPYINAHRGRIFVVYLGTDVVGSNRLAEVVHDLALLNSLGIQLVLVHGARKQIEARLAESGIESGYENGVRITGAATLRAALEAIGHVRLSLEALFSMGLPNSPMAGAKIRLASGNFLTGRPLGVRDGVDYGLSGEVRRVDTQGIRARLDLGDIVLVSPVGYSPTGEVFNLQAASVATAIAIELHASKLLFLDHDVCVRDNKGTLVPELTLDEAKAKLTKLRRSKGDPIAASHALMESAVHACRHGVDRVQLLDHAVDGALLLELFTRDGVGTMINADTYDTHRRANIDDVGGILELIQPLEEQGLLVRRSRDRLENDIQQFTVLERDGAIIGCAAAYPFVEEGVAELACLAINPSYRESCRGEALLRVVEKDMLSQGIGELFVLTTQASHWFKERGFAPARLDELPVQKQSLYNYARNSKILVKTLVRE